MVEITEERQKRKCLALKRESCGGALRGNSHENPADSGVETKIAVPPVASAQLRLFQLSV